MEDKKQPIIIKKIKKGGHAHHGGAWKVAFADFVTAMMAFFLLLWLLNSVTAEQLGGISQYFQNVSMVEGTATVPSQGASGPGGASTSIINLGGGLDAMKRGEGQVHKEIFKVVEKTREQDERDKDQARLDSLMQDLRAAVEQSQTLAPYKDQLLLDITPEGLRIQIVDKENRPMFESGNARLKYYTEEILLELANFINTVPNRISISGHTDSQPFFGKDGYSNWELSADRANSARRALVEGGLAQGKLARVVGLADSVPIDANDTISSKNRRISLIIMNRQTEQALTENNSGGLLNDQAAATPATEIVETASDGPLNQPMLETLPGQAGAVEQAGDDAPLNPPMLIETGPAPRLAPVPAPAPPQASPPGHQPATDNELNRPAEADNEPAGPATGNGVAPPGSTAPIRIEPAIDPNLLPRSRLQQN